MNDFIDSIKNLTPIVAVTLIFAVDRYLMAQNNNNLILSLNEENMRNHKEKTIAFNDEQKRKDDVNLELTQNVIDVVKNSSIIQEKLSNSIDSNTRAIDQMLNVRNNA